MTSWTPTPSWALFFSEQLWFLVILFKTSNWNRWIPPFSQCGFFTSCLTTSQPSGISNCIISVQIRCSVVYMPSVFLFIWIGTPIYFPSAKWPSPVQHATNGERGRNGNWGDLCSWIRGWFSGTLPCQAGYPAASFTRICWWNASSVLLIRLSCAGTDKLKVDNMLTKLT